MTGPIVETRGLEVRFALPTHFLSRDKPVLHALSGVDVAIKAGETFCVVGESGCGKTTLGRAIMGLLKPSAGEILFRGQRIFPQQRPELALAGYQLGRVRIALA